MPTHVVECLLSLGTQLLVAVVYVNVKRFIFALFVPEHFTIIEVLVEIC